jgi:hypothetical protein
VGDVASWLRKPWHRGVSPSGALGGLTTPKLSFRERDRRLAVFSLCEVIDELALSYAQRPLHVDSSRPVTGRSRQPLRRCVLMARSHGRPLSGTTAEGRDDPRPAQGQVRRGAARDCFADVAPSLFPSERRILILIWEPEDIHGSAGGGAGSGCATGRGSQSTTSSQCNRPKPSPATMRFGRGAAIARTGRGRLISAFRRFPAKGSP